MRYDVSHSNTKLAQLSKAMLKASLAVQNDPERGIHFLRTRLARSIIIRIICSKQYMTGVNMYIKEQKQ